MTVSVVIPARNEEETLAGVLEELDGVRSDLPDHKIEILVVDDHSTDRTAEVATRHGVTVLRNQGSPGKGQALRCGFERAGGDILVMMDADGSHQPRDLSTMLAALRDRVGLVIASRIYGGSEEYTRVRAFGNLMLTYAFGFFHGLYLSDALNGYKAFRRDVFTDFTYTSREFEIEIELLVNAIRKGYLIKEVPGHERPRKGGKAKSRVARHGTKFLARIIYEWLRYR